MFWNQRGFVALLMNPTVLRLLLFQKYFIRGAKLTLTNAVAALNESVHSNIKRVQVQLLVFLRLYKERAAHCG